MMIPGGAIAQCKMCGGRNVASRANGRAYWFDCRTCGYSTPGRRDAEKALGDVDWVSVLKPEEEPESKPEE